MIHILKDFRIVNETQVDVFLELTCFFYDSMDVGNFFGYYRSFVFIHTHTHTHTHTIVLVQ